jgi:hypothetical protein
MNWLGVAEHYGRPPCGKRSNEESALDEPVVPQLSGHHADHCLILAERGPEAGVAAAYQSGNSDGRKYSHPSKRLGREVITDPGG